MRRAARAFSLTAWVLALAVAGTSAYATIWFTHAAPFADQWDLTARFLTGRGADPFASWYALWSPHNEHRLLTFNLVNAIDLVWFGGSNLFNRAAVLAAMVGSVGLFLTALHRAGVERRALAGLVAPVVLAAIFNGAQSENLTWALGFQWHAANLFFLAGLLSMLSMCGARSLWPWLTAGVVSSVLAGCSSANGLLAWPSLLLLGIFLRVSATPLALYAAGGVFFGALYAMGGAGSDAVSAALHAPLDVFAYAARFLGSIWYWADAPLQGEAFAVVVGYGILALAALFGVALVLRSTLLRPCDAVLAAVLVFVTGAALLTATGRVSLSVDQALAPRYASATGLLWAALLTWPAIALSRRRIGVAAACGALVFWALVALAAHQPKMLKTAAGWYDDRELASLALLVGVRDDDLLRRIYPEPARLPALAERWSTERQSIFGQPRAAYVGRDIRGLFPVDDKPCLAAGESVEAVSRVADAAAIAYRAHGWAWDNSRRKPAAAILLTDETATVIGLGRSGEPRPDVRTSHPEVQADDTGWTAVIRPTGRQLGAFALTGSMPNLVVCEIGWWTLTP